ncbi:DUF3575 domain-containing protein [Hwangdonia lutea]|uniref:DUF3575 domain-containing protein n=1 Tax=Hwangdonia lutea TaxID=3075823 RepID=A0AA97ENT3_9FLAO|nr:DUF3575 domain-containing protein [Hwangdonia sp. SCSIO 19198]WOD44831.1 DUF3575 domain-containing protein [Hwangdonia sp. SCSIO 19198]
MKKLLLFPLVALFFYSTSFSQNETQNETDNSASTQNFNEIKLNGLFLIIGALDVTYERTLNEESGVGISILLPIDNNVSDDIKYMISPYYRFYFGEKYAGGFFLEGFGMLNSTNREINFSNDTYDFRTDFALGIGLGGKWITKSGFIGELSFGVGRNLFNNKNTDYEIIGKGGISIGYRF